jgi:hypothetical protein
LPSQEDFKNNDGISYYYTGAEAFMVYDPKNIKHIDNTGVYSKETPNMYDDYETISELNNYD